MNSHCILPIIYNFLQGNLHLPEYEGKISCSDASDKKSNSMQFGTPTYLAINKTRNILTIYSWHQTEKKT